MPKRKRKQRKEGKFRKIDWKKDTGQPFTQKYGL